MSLAENRKDSFIRASLAVSAATMLLRLTGFFREAALAAAYGAGTVSDAFVVAMSVPMVLLAMFANAVNAVYIPQRANIKGDKDAFTSSLLTLMFAIGLLFALCFAVFPETLVYVFAAGAPPETFALAAKLLSLTAWSAAPMMLTGIFRGYLQIKGRFFVAMVSEALINLFIIASIAGGRLAGAPLVMGAGVAVGNAAAALLLLALCLGEGLRVRPRLDVRDGNIKETFRLMLPVMLSGAVVEINQIVDKNLASSLVAGTISSLNYAAKINNIFTALIGRSVGVAIYPAMSEMAAKNDMDAINENLSYWIKKLLAIILPFTIGSCLMAHPVIRVFLERGAFSSENTLMTAQCFQMYNLGLVAVNVNLLLTRAFYSIKNTKLPAILSTASLAVGIALDFAFVGPMRHSGLALATSVSSMLYMVLQIIALRKIMGKLGLRGALTEFVKVALASAFMGVSVWFLMGHSPIMSGTYGQCLLWTVIIAGAGALVYAASLVLLRAEFAAGVLGWLKKRG